jgi:hypothetical protein
MPGWAYRLSPFDSSYSSTNNMGGPWNWSKGLRDQELFDEHARFLDGLVDEGYIVLGGPLAERDVLLVVPDRDRGFSPLAIRG